MKRLFTLLPLILFALSISAADGDVKKTTVDGIEWTYTIVSETDKYCDLGGYTSNDAGDAIYYPAIDVNITGALSIPSTLDGYTVGSIGIEGFHGCKISSVTITEGVTYIDDYAFAECSQLTTVICDALPFDISESAFEGLTDQVTVYFPVDYGEQFQSRKGWNKLSKWFEKGVEERKQTLTEQMYAIMDELAHLANVLSEKATESEAPELYDEFKILQKRTVEIRYRIEDARTVEVVSREIPPALEELRARLEYLSVKIENYQPSEKIAINEENFPDEHFREYVTKYIDKDYDGALSLEECAAVKRIFENGTVHWTDISDVKGIEYFTELETLNLFTTRVTSLDLSKNTALKTLRIRDDYGNRYLESLDISKNLALEVLDVSATKLTSLNVSHLKNLKELYCSGLQLGTLDISNNLSLEVLACGSNDLTSLDVSNHLSLKKLSCFRNKLTSLDMSKLTALTSLQCDYNQLTSLDLSNNLALDTLSCGGNNLGVLDVSKLAELNYLSCNFCGLTDLDLSKNTKLEYLYCIGNPLTKLDLSKNPELRRLECNGEKISETEVYQLTSLDVTSNTKLEVLRCNNNLFTTLDVTKNTALRSLYCHDNQLTTLDVSQNTNLESLYCYGNLLTSLDVSNNTALQSLSCYDNQLTSIDISKNADIRSFDCSNNQIEHLDVSANEKLYSVVCEQNRMKSLKVSPTTNSIRCARNAFRGAVMDSLISNLPVVSDGEIYIIDTLYADEKNVCTKAQVAALKEKGWTARVRHPMGTYFVGDIYEGSDPKTLDPIDNNENINIGNDINSDTNLDGNVVGNILYNISSGNGEFNPEEGCIVVSKPVSDETMNNLEGKDIFGEDFKDQYTGIVFKVAEGKGSVKVEAQTTGNMVLKVKIGNNDPIEMELDGKLKITFPYNVSEETLVYIYGSTKAAQAKRNMKGVTNTESGSLKIFGIEITSEGTGIQNNIVDEGPQDVYSLSGQKIRSKAKDLKGLPAGVYIVSGKKVFVK